MKARVVTRAMSLAQDARGRVCCITTKTTPSLLVWSRMANCLALTRPRITLLILGTTLTGFYLGIKGDVEAGLLLHTLVGTALTAAGASALNQYLEYDVDARMRRTANRPLPAGRMKLYQALILGAVLSVLGVVYLGLMASPLSGILAAFTVGSYIFIYTPLKRKTPLSTLVGAVPGAIPPLLGWTAVRGTLDWQAGMLFLLLFIWQMPHFLAIAWVYRSDYQRAGLPMLSVADPTGVRLRRQIMFYCLFLLPVSLGVSLLNLAGSIYFVGALLLGLLFLASAIRFARLQSMASARQVLLASVFYLPMLLLLMVVDKGV